jgi:hypothetical protein
MTHLDVLAQEGCKEQSEILDKILNLRIVRLIVGLTDIYTLISQVREAKIDYLSLMG